MARTALDDLQDLGRLVEEEARLELPADVHAVVGRHLAALVPDGDEPVHAELRVHASDCREEVRRLDAIDADRLDVQVGRERGEAEERGHVGRRVLVQDRRPGLLEAPQIDGDAGEGQAVVRDLLLQLLP